jgi:hypothetical protein
MTQESSRDVRTHGYIMVFIGLFVAGQAVDRIFFHKAFGLRWLTAASALIVLAGGTWMIIKRRRPLDWLDDLAKERWGSLGTWMVTAVFAAVVVASIWGLSRLN